MFSFSLFFLRQVFLFFLILHIINPHFRSNTNEKKISFGVAPATLAFTLGLRTPIDSLLLTFFILCGLSRLARFNVTVAALPKDASGKSKYFEGTPIPTTLSIAALMAYCVHRGWIHGLDGLPGGTLGGSPGSWFEWHPVALVFVLSGAAMVSRSIHIPKL